MIEEKKRIYYGKVAVVGQSGSGKSYLTKTLDRETTGYINIERKPLSYKAEPFKFEGKPNTWSGFIKNFTDYVANPEIKTLVIDSLTMGLNMLIKEMGVRYTGYDIYKYYNKEVYEFLERMRSAEKDILIFAHDELNRDDNGEKSKRMATHGREFDGKLEQHFTIVLYTGSRFSKEGKPEYFLKTFEPGTSAKSPEGLFPTIEISNDGNFIINQLQDYYS